ncbi:imidazolonepropionase [Alloacidobacterium dinghuense]|uniref:Imidazolonepropionase n=1 Tax=Alloacidobacterium dinghuense TaxID=2763107 RepID=A0A7G8BIG9_9BACT|nr:imidazolonepropionase [Alloacidobacterium dinghuense]QNI32339.1 imidazolonepropionase [Alloacidobacterium dinghuense]
MSQFSSLLITNCSQLVTLAGPSRPRLGLEMRDLGIVDDGAMLVRDRRIAAVGARNEIEPAATDDTEVIDVGGRVVMPGFVDAHTHLVFAGNRAEEFEMRCAGMTYQQIAERGGGIRSTVRSTREATEGELVTAGQKHARWFLQGGTTTVEAKSGYGLTVHDELKLLRAIRRVSETTSLRCVPTFLGAHEIPDEYKTQADKYVDLIVDEMLPVVAKENLAEFCDVFCESKVFSVTQADRVLSAAKRLGLGLRVHADQFTSSGAIDLAATLGAKTVDHLEQTTRDSIAVMKKLDVQPVLLPGSVYAIGSQKYAPARAMIEAGLPVVIATDFNPGSSPTTSMTMILSLACTQMKMTPAEAVTASTINAAWSLNRAHEIGSLEPGRIADFVIHDAEDYRELAYFFGNHRPHAVFAAGVRV